MSDWQATGESHSFRGKLIKSDLDYQPSEPVRFFFDTRNEYGFTLHQAGILRGGR
jgi:hypothetical protein